ncbi:hypothetical protein IGI96_003751 [Enterococcus sp. DIV0421]
MSFIMDLLKFDPNRALFYAKLFCATLFVSFIANMIGKVIV